MAEFVEDDLDLKEFLSDSLCDWLFETDGTEATSSGHALNHTSNVSFTEGLGSTLDSLLLSALELTIGEEKPKALTAIKGRQFADPVSVEDIQRAKQKSVPKSTQRDTEYCIRIWDECRKLSTNDTIPPLSEISTKQLQYWMCRFVLEVRKKEGAEFPPNTLHHICCGIMRYVRNNGNPGLDIFQDKEFAEFRAVLDSEMKRLQAAGLGSQKKQAEPITMEEEELFWQKGLLGESTPQSLLDTMVYMNGLYFALRGGKEHRDLRYNPSQIQLIEKPGERPYLLYTEDISKNHPGGLRGRNVKPKIVTHHANITNPRRCFVRLYKLYHSLCPPNRPENAYYLQPLKKPHNGCWYAPVPVGHTKLRSTISRLCSTAEIPGYRTNHSLRATAATRLHQSGMVQEQDIMARTGHRSVEGVRSYKRTSTDQIALVSDILSNGPKRACPPHFSSVCPPPYSDSVVLPDQCSSGQSLPSEHEQLIVPPAVSAPVIPSCMSLNQASMAANTAPTFNISSCNSITIQYVCK